jgi:5-methylcytosine-specific restriction endonuclease McrA
MSRRGKTWERARAQAYARDKGRCVVCGASEGPTVHHIRPRIIGGEHRPENLVTLCRACHDGVESVAHRATGLLLWLVYGPLLKLARIAAPLRWKGQSE